MVYLREACFGHPQTNSMKDSRDALLKGICPIRYNKELIYVGPSVPLNTTDSSAVYEVVPCISVVSSPRWAEVAARSFSTLSYL